MKTENRPDDLAKLTRFLESDDGCAPESQPPKELFQQVSNISLCMAYDLIDKIRYWEKESLALPDRDVAKRIPHIARCLERLKVAYLEFADTDL